MTLCKYWHALPRRSGEIRAAKVEQERLLGQPGNTGAAVPGPSPALGSCQGRLRAGKRQRQLRELPALSTGTETETVPDPAALS